MVIKVLLFS